MVPTKGTAGRKHREHQDHGQGVDEARDGGRPRNLSLASLTSKREEIEKRAGLREVRARLHAGRR